MKRFFGSMLGSFIGVGFALGVFVLVMVGVGSMMGSQEIADVEDGSYLIIDIYGQINEYDPPQDIIGMATGNEAETLQRILTNLEMASVDSRIEGVVLKLSYNNSLGWAKVQEIRNAIDRFQESGKKVHVWSDSMNLGMLYLSGTCDGTYMPPSGMLEFKGLASWTMHVKDMLDKLGVEVHLHKIKDYKSATELFTESEMTEATREMKTWILDDVWNQVIPTIATERGLTEEKVLELMQYALFQVSEGVVEGLIDGEMYWQELEKTLVPDGEFKTISQDDYATITRHSLGLEGDGVIAVVHAQGNIGGRESRVDPALGLMMGHESVCKELRKCREKDYINAVVFRIDSGGGESLASDLIAHEIDLLSQVKPVVISMVDVAGSGGYMIAYKGTKMLADPLTITGSIGSINGFFVTSGLDEKLGMGKDYVEKGPMALMHNAARTPTEQEWNRHVDAHWKSFNSWLADVADRRGMEFAEAEKLAHGRIWTGTQATENGLIDGTGDLYDAIAMAKELAELPAEENVALLHYPEPKEMMEMVMEMLGGDVDVSQSIRNSIYIGVQKDFNSSMQFMQNGSYNIVQPPRP
ncbi:hypothetical protein HN843_02385 [bacterium]|jgi:protease IV|nr:hypothetical protein [bacterium]